MTLSEILTLILTICTIGISAIALLISLKQGKMQNNLSLLDRRIDLLEVARSLTEPVQYHRVIFEKDLINKENKPIYAIDFSFDLLVNSSFLESIQGVSKHPLDNDFQNRFLKKLEEIRRMSDMFVTCFSEHVCTYYSDLCLLYVQTLTNAYRYAVALNGLRKDEINLGTLKNDSLEVELRKKYRDSLKLLIEKVDEITSLKLYDVLKQATKI